MNKQEYIEGVLRGYPDTILQTFDISDVPLVKVYSDESIGLEDLEDVPLKNYAIGFYEAISKEESETYLFGHEEHELEWADNAYFTDDFFFMTTEDLKYEILCDISQLRVMLYRY